MGLRGCGCTCPSKQWRSVLRIAMRYFNEKNRMELKYSVGKKKRLCTILCPVMPCWTTFLGCTLFFFLMLIKCAAMLPHWNPCRLDWLPRDMRTVERWWVMLLSRTTPSVRSRVVLKSPRINHVGVTRRSIDINHVSWVKVPSSSIPNLLNFQLRFA
jgi:hypothetical protein